MPATRNFKSRPWPVNSESYWPNEGPGNREFDRRTLAAAAHLMKAGMADHAASDITTSTADNFIIDELKKYGIANKGAWTIIDIVIYTWLEDCMQGVDGGDD